MSRISGSSYDSRLMSRSGDGSTLSLDFTAMGGVLDPRLTFSRASTATYINSSGYVTTMGAAPTNDPTKARFDYDPVTLAPRGLLIEGTGINIIRYSAAPQSWSAVVSGTTITDGSGLAPDNSSTPKQLAMTSGAYCYQVTQSNQVAGTYTYSVWLKASSAQSVGVRVSRTGDGSVKGMITAAVTTTWKRFEVKITSNATDTLDCGFDQRSIPPSVPGPGVAATFLMWGAQLELGSGASSYIPTGASQVTRNPDQCYIYDATTSGGLSWFKTATQGTIYVEAYKRTAGTSFAGALYGTRATATQDFMLYQAIGNNWLSLNWGASEYVTNYSALSSPFLIKSAVAFSPGSPTTKADSTVSINGSNSAINTTPNIALPFASDLFCIGSRGSAGGVEPTQNYADTAIRRIKFYPFAMTAAQMNTLTTL